MKESGKMDIVIIGNKKTHKTNPFGTKHWGLLIMGKDGRRGERETKFLAVNFFSTPMERLWKIREKCAGVSQKRFLSCQGAQY